MSTVVRFELRWVTGSGRSNKARFDTEAEAHEWYSNAAKNGRVFTLVKVTVTEEELPLSD